MAIIITDEMRKRAKIESDKRDKFIRHHFELKYMTPSQRDIVGFIGEFACKTELGIEWRSSIRENYYTIDNGDITICNGDIEAKKLVIDIKTETIPYKILMNLVKKKISDDAPYGRRLINEGQIELLPKYDYIIWGAIPRNEQNKWYFLGFLDTKTILNEYKPTIDTPFGGKYSESCLNVKQSQLKPLWQLKRLINSYEE